MHSYRSRLWVSIVLLGFWCCSAPIASAGGFPQAWGTSSFGLTNPPSNLTNVIGIASGQNHVIALHENGTITGWGDPGPFGKTSSPPGLSGVRAIAAGWNHNLALLESGRVVAWGNLAPETNVPPAATSGVRAIAAGEYHSLAVKSNGTVVGWGSGTAATPPPGLANVRAVAAGGQHSLALLNDGTVFAWGGNNGSGQLNVPFGLRNVIAVAAGADFSLALRTDGSVAAWGNLAEGRGNAPASGVTAIAAGFGHGVALLNTRRVVAWGANLSGQTTVPGNVSNAVQVAAGNGHSVALRWRPPRFVSQPQNLTVPQGTTATFAPTITGSTPLSFQWRKAGADIPGATNLSLVISDAQLSDQGTYTLFISNLVGTITSSNATLTVNAPVAITQQPQSADVTEGGTLTLSVTATGSIPIAYQWRKDGTNILGALSSSYTISSAQPGHSGNYTVVVSNAFRVQTSIVAVVTVNSVPGIYSQPQNQSVLVGSSVTFQVGASNATFFQWRKNNTNLAGATMPILALNNVQLPHAGNYSVVVGNQWGSVTSSTAVLTVNSTQPDPLSPVRLWGEDPVWTVESGYTSMRVPDGLANVRGLAAGAYHQLVLFANGSMLGWGDNFYGQAGAPNTTNVVAIAAGEHHSLARTAGGTVLVWGRNNHGQLNVPPNLSNIVDIAAGANHNLALKSDGNVVAWGLHLDGRTNVPVNVSNAVKVAAGWDHSLALLSDGTVRGWGNNDYGQRVPPPFVTNVIPMAAGLHHSIALKSDGTVVAWGRNNFEQLNVPSNLTEVIAITAGENHSLALRRDGTIVGWGQNNFGQTTIPGDAMPALAIAAGGKRSLALKGKALRLLPPVPLGNNRYLLRVMNQDGSPIDPARANRIILYFAGRADRPRTEWLKLTTPWTVVGSYLQVEDTTPSTAMRRFWHAQEDPP